MYYNLTAIILKRQDFREDDLLITVYSRERGKLTFQAKGAKKIKSKLAGHLEPVSLSSLEAVDGKQLDQLVGARIMESYRHVKADLMKLAYASYFLELVERLTVEGCNDEKIFELLRKALFFLNQESPASPSKEWRAMGKSLQPCQMKNSGQEYKLARISFGFKLLDILGLNPEKKTGIELGKGIRLIVESSIDKIKADQSLIDKLAGLNRILNGELGEHLNGQLRSEEFLGKIISKLAN